MKEMKFIPYWYYEKIKTRRKNMFRIIFIIILVCNIALIYHFILGLQKYKGLIRDINALSDTTLAVGKGTYNKAHQEFEINKSLDIFRNYIDGKLEYSNAEISNNSIGLEIPVNGYNTYTYVIDALDGIKDVYIQGIQTINKGKISDSLIRIELKIR